MKNFNEFIKENAMATAGNTGGMGAVVSAQPSATPGDTAGGTKGSGDIGHGFGDFMKYSASEKIKKRKKRKKLKKFGELTENFIDKITYEMSGSPKPYYKTKADFVAAMQDCGYYHTTLNKKTDMLVVTDEDLGTGKCIKAEKYGIPIYTYSYAKKHMKSLIDRAAKYNL